MRNGIYGKYRDPDKEESAPFPEFTRGCRVSESAVADRNAATTIYRNWQLCLGRDFTSGRCGACPARRGRERRASRLKPKGSVASRKAFPRETVIRFSFGRQGQRSDHRARRPMPCGRSQMR